DHPKVISGEERNRVENGKHDRREINHQQQVDFAGVGARPSDARGCVLDRRRGGNHVQLPGKEGLSNFSDYPIDANFMTAGSVASLCASSPVIRPSRMTMTRSETARTSGKSEEMTITAVPFPARSYRRL